MFVMADRNGEPVEFYTREEVNQKISYICEVTDDLQAQINYLRDIIQESLMTYKEV